MFYKLDLEVDAPKKSPFLDANSSYCDIKLPLYCNTQPGSITSYVNINFAFLEQFIHYGYNV
jgi:hypothetical protein